MSNRIRCYTLFDITRTGVPNRARPQDENIDKIEWYKKRSTQCNFDTILQIISLRAQPEVSEYPKCIEMVMKDKTMFGSQYVDYNIRKVWTFDFDVHNSVVFATDNDELGALYHDCENVPMIVTENSSVINTSTLQIDNNTKNIYFVKY